MKSNYVLLTAKEHLVCHMLLPYIYNYRGLWLALYLMSKNAKTKGLRISSRMYEFFRLKADEVRQNIEERQNISDKAKKRWAKWKENGEVEIISKNISEATSKAMKNPEIIEKTRINKGSRWYTNIQTGEARHWYPGNEIPDPNIWRLGRPPMKEEIKKKISDIQRNNKKCRYYNDSLKKNKMFLETEPIPEGWIKGLNSNIQAKKIRICAQLRCIITMN